MDEVGYHIPLDVNYVLKAIQERHIPLDVNYVLKAIQERHIGSVDAMQLGFLYSYAGEGIIALMGGIAGLGIVGVIGIISLEQQILDKTLEKNLASTKEVMDQHQVLKTMDYKTVDKVLDTLRDIKPRQLVPN